jgi:peptidoglycan/xylan/chitin deacetylase (PgdA/CDA1 family)
LPSRSTAIAVLCILGINLNALLLWRTVTQPAVTPIYAHAAHTLAAPAAPQPHLAPPRARRPGLVVALTFDDGPQPYYTQAVLDLLRHYGIHATFFVIGRQAAAFPELLRAEAADGNEVENHTWNHANLRLRSFYDATAEIAGTADEVLLVTGRAPRYLRPPYGSVNAYVRQEAASLGEQVVLWNVDPRDWARPGVLAIESNVLQNVRNRSIILMHDGGGRRDETLLALRTVIPTLKARGYRFVTVQQLLDPLAPAYGTVDRLRTPPPPGISLDSPSR